MNKKTKMYVGLAVVAVAAYYFYNKKKKEAAVAPAATASFVGKRMKTFAPTDSTGHSKQ